jgi:hypothetical protein
MRFGLLMSGALALAAAVTSLAFADEAKADGPLGSAPPVLATVTEALEANEPLPIAEGLTTGAVTPDGESSVSDIIDAAVETLEPLADASAPVLQSAAPVVEAVEQVASSAIDRVVPALPALIDPLLPVTALPALPAELEPAPPTLVTRDVPVVPQPETGAPSPSPAVVAPAVPPQFIGAPTTAGQLSTIPRIVRVAAIPVVTFVPPIAAIAHNDAIPAERPVAPSSAWARVPAVLASGSGSSRAPTPDAPTGAACLAALAILGALAVWRGPRLTADTLPYSRACLPAVPPG